MGIKKLLKVEVNGVPLGDIYTELRQSDIEGVIGVDALIVLIQSLTNGPILKDKQGRVTLHINTLVNKLLKMNNKQIWVFDNQIKVETKLQTVKARKFKAEVFNHIKLGDAINDYKNVLKALGVPYITAPPKVEAENYLVELKRMGVIDYILSTDTDVLAYGEDLLSYKKDRYYLYKIDNILRSLKMDLPTFRKMCCLLGNDFNDKIVGVTHLKILDNLHKALTDEQSITYVMFSLRVSLRHTKEELTPSEPVFGKEIIEYLEQRDFVQLVNKLK